MAPDYESVLRANTEAVESLEKRLQVVQQILEEIANELGWVTRNVQDLAMGDGAGNHSEQVQCMECECERVRGLAEALRQQWTDLMLHDGRYVGLCPACSEDIERSRADAPPPRTRRITVDAEQFANAMENVEVLSETIDELPMTCAECHSIADVPAATAVEHGWKDIGETVDGIVGICPDCAKREPVTAQQPAKAPSSRPPRAPVVAAPVQAPKRRGKQQPLYMRMFQDRHMTGLVRAVGYAGFPASEIQDRLKPLIDEYGETLVRAAADEVIEVDGTQIPAIARLTADARKYATGLLGRPPPEQPQPGTPPTIQEPPPTEDTAPRDAKPRRRRKAKSDQET